MGRAWEAEGDVGCRRPEAEGFFEAARAAWMVRRVLSDGDAIQC